METQELASDVSEHHIIKAFDLTTRGLEVCALLNLLPVKTIKQIMPKIFAAFAIRQPGLFPNVQQWNKVESRDRISTTNTIQAMNKEADETKFAALKEIIISHLSRSMSSLSSLDTNCANEGGRALLAKAVLGFSGEIKCREFRIVPNNVTTEVNIDVFNAACNLATQGCEICALLNFLPLSSETLIETMNKIISSFENDTVFPFEVAEWSTRFVARKDIVISILRTMSLESDKRAFATLQGTIIAQLSKSFVGLETSLSADTEEDARLLLTKALERFSGTIGPWCQNDRSDREDESSVCYSPTLELEVKNSHITRAFELCTTGIEICALLKILPVGSSARSQGTTMRRIRYYFAKCHANIFPKKDWSWKEDEDRIKVMRIMRALTSEQKDRFAIRLLKAAARPPGACELKGDEFMEEGRVLLINALARIDNTVHDPVLEEAIVEAVEIAEIIKFDMKKQHKSRNYFHSPALNSDIVNGHFTSACGLATQGIEICALLSILPVDKSRRSIGAAVRRIRSVFQENKIINSLLLRDMKWSQTSCQTKLEITNSIRAINAESDNVAFNSLKTAMNHSSLTEEVKADDFIHEGRALLVKAVQHFERIGCVISSRSTYFCHNPNALNAMAVDGHLGKAVLLATTGVEMCALLNMLPISKSTRGMGQTMGRIRNLFAKKMDSFPAGRKWQLASRATKISSTNFIRALNMETDTEAFEKLRSALKPCYTPLAAFDEFEDEGREFLSRALKCFESTPDTGIIGLSSGDVDIDTSINENHTSDAAEQGHHSTDKRHSADSHKRKAVADHKVIAKKRASQHELQTHNRASFDVTQPNTDSHNHSNHETQSHSPSIVTNHVNNASSCNSSALPALLNVQGSDRHKWRGHYRQHSLQAVATPTEEETSRMLTMSVDCEELKLLSEAMKMLSEQMKSDTFAVHCEELQQQTLLTYSQLLRDILCISQQQEFQQ